MNEDDFEQLVDDVIFEAGDRVAAFDWGTAGVGHDKRLKEAKDAVLAEHKRLLTLVNSARTVLKHEVIEIANLATMVDQVGTAQYMASVYSLIHEMEKPNE